MRRKRLEGESAQWEGASIDTAEEVEESRESEDVESLESWVIIRRLEE